ncbi:Predicted oxidoreductase [bacterium A37T11]|nr:Predicted oxidoreductase [bacterium A37T11]
MAILGKSDLEVGTVSFGCMSLGDNQAQNSQLLRKAVDHGIRFFDTADLYDKGINELQVGTALKEVRKNVILATKVGNQWRPDGSGWDWNPRKDYILKAVEQSLKRLKTDYIDLYQLHGGTIDDPIDETIEAFEQLKTQGKIRWYGLSSIRPNVIKEYIKRSNIVSVMMQYSLLDTRPEEEMLDLLAAQDVGLITRGTTAGGLLLGKPAKTYLQYTGSEVARAAKMLAAIAQEMGKEPSQLALAYVYHHPTVKTAVIGIRTAEQLDEWVRQMNDPLVIDAARLNRLNAVIRKFYYQDHR